MIIPLSESQLRTYLDTGKVTIEIPCTREHSQETPGPSNDSLFYDPAEWRRWAERHPERAARTIVWGDAWSNCETGESGVDWSWGHEDGGGTTELEAPCLPGDRVAIGELWAPTGIEGLADHKIDHCGIVIPKWQPADTMPVWAARYYATVATIAFERRGDRWAWIVGLEAE